MYFKWRQQHYLGQVWFLPREAATLLRVCLILTCFGLMDGTIYSDSSREFTKTCHRREVANIIYLISSFMKKWPWIKIIKVHHVKYDFLNSHPRCLISICIILYSQKKFHFLIYSFFKNIPSKKIVLTQK